MAQALTQTEECPHCEGRGWILEHDGGAGTARRCDCWKRRVSTDLLARSGIPELYLHCSLENFKTSHPNKTFARRLKEAQTVSRRYVAGYQRADGKYRDFGLIYVGPPGVGKTHLAAAVLREIMQQFHIAGRFIDFSTLIHQLQASFDRDTPETKHGILDRITGAPLLVLDELGAQKPTPWVQDILYQVINTRYSRRRPTIFTTNYSLETSPTPELEKSSAKEWGSDAPRRGPEPLERRIPSALVSRLHEMARPVHLERVEDFRRAVKKTRLKV